MQSSCPAKSDGRQGPKCVAAARARRACALRPDRHGARPRHSQHRATVALTSLDYGVLAQLNHVRIEHGLVPLHLNLRLSEVGRRALARDGRRRLLRPRLVRRHDVLEADRAVVPVLGLPGTGRSARTCSGRRRTSIRRGALKLWMALARASREHPEPELARDRDRRGPRRRRARRLRRPAGHDHHDRLRRPPTSCEPRRATLAGDAPVAQWTERRPSKPLVGGSNPPGRTDSGGRATNGNEWHRRFRCGTLWQSGKRSR